MVCVLLAVAVEIGPYEKFDPEKVHNSLTAGSLRGPGKLAIPPMVFAKDDESESVGQYSHPLLIELLIRSLPLLFLLSTAK